MLGPEFGGSIGVIFTIANAMDSSLNAVGFAQTVQDMMKEYGGLIIVDGPAGRFSDGRQAISPTAGRPYRTSYIVLLIYRTSSVSLILMTSYLNR